MRQTNGLLIIVVPNDAIHSGQEKRRTIMALRSSDFITSDIDSSSIDVDGSRNIELQCYHFISRTVSINYYPLYVM